MLILSFPPSLLLDFSGFNDVCRSAPNLCIIKEATFKCLRHTRGYERQKDDPALIEGPVENPWMRITEMRVCSCVDTDACVCARAHMCECWEGDESTATSWGFWENEVAELKPEGSPGVFQWRRVSPKAVQDKGWYSPSHPREMVVSPENCHSAAGESSRWGFWVFGCKFQETHLCWRQMFDDYALLINRQCRRTWFSNHHRNILYAAMSQVEKTGS